MDEALSNWKASFDVEDAAYNHLLQILISFGFVGQELDSSPLNGGYMEGNLQFSNIGNDTNSFMDRPVWLNEAFPDSNILESGMLVEEGYALGDRNPHIGLPFDAYQYEHSHPGPNSSTGIPVADLGASVTANSTETSALSSLSRGLTPCIPCWKGKRKVRSPIKYLQKLIIFSAVPRRLGYVSDVQGSLFLRKFAFESATPIIRCSRSVRLCPR